jgi:hypothetical protein
LILKSSSSTAAPWCFNFTLDVDNTEEFTNMTDMLGEKSDEQGGARWQAVVAPARSYLRTRKNERPVEFNVQKLGTARKGQLLVFSEDCAVLLQLLVTD